MRKLILRKCSFFRKHSKHCVEYYKVPHCSEKFYEFWRAIQKAEEMRKLYPNERIGIETYIDDKGNSQRFHPKSFRRKELQKNIIKDSFVF